MRVLFCWDGAKPLPDDRGENIEIVKRFYPHAQYYCLTRLPEFMGMTVIDWDAQKQILADEFGIPINPLWERQPHLTDWFRFWFLGRNPGTLYLDTDVKMLKQFDFESCETPLYAGWVRKYLHVGISILWSPTNGSGIEFYNTLKANPRCEWVERLVTKVAGAKPLSREYFYHHI